MDASQRRAAAMGTVFLVPVLLHLRTLGFGFIWDDDANVTANALLVGDDQLRRIWSGDGIYQYYPLTFLSYWLQDRTIGLSAAACHAVNVVLHGTVSMLLYQVLRTLRVPAAFWGALLFGVHPLATETVAWVTERKNLLAATFGLGAVLAYLHSWSGEADGAGRPRNAPQVRPAGRARAVGVSLFLFLLAVLAKTHAVILPAVLLLLELWRRGSGGRWGPPHVTLGSAVEHAPGQQPGEPEQKPAWGRASIRLLPFFLVATLFAIITVRFETRHVIRDGAAWEWAWTIPEKLVLAGKVLTFYLGKIVWPHPLAFIYEPWSLDASRWTSWLPSLLWLGALGIFFLARRSWGRHPFLATAAFVVALSPVLGFFPVYFMRYAFVQDHFAYFALLVAVPALVAAAATGVVRALGSGRADGSRTAVGVAVGVAVGLLFSILSWRHQGDFRDLETLWTRTVEKSPRAWMAQTNLGVLRSQQGRLDEAAQLHRRAIEIDPRRAEPHNNLGFALEAAGDVSGAIEQYRMVTEIEPDDPVGFYNLGNALARSNREREAIAAFEAALSRNRAYPQALNGLGVVLARSGRLSAATEHWAEALVIAPGFRDAFDNLRLALETDLAPGVAVDLMARVSQATQGRNPTIEVLYARALMRVGDMDSAALAVDRAEEALADGDAGAPWLRVAIMETRAAIAE